MPVKVLKSSRHYCLLTLLSLCTVMISEHPLCAQGPGQEIYSDYVLYPKRERLEKDLRENITARSFALELDSNNEHKFESACLAVSQFLFSGPGVKAGFEQLFAQYDQLQFETKRAFLEAVYAVYPMEYPDEIRAVLGQENDPLLFAMAAVYIFRQQHTIEAGNDLKISMVERFPGYDSIPVLQELEYFINGYGHAKNRKLPPVSALFAHQRLTGRKVVYSLQRWNRDHPGLAIVQHANGKFARDSNGRLLIFQQLARSASDLPYFITNGSTPQGAYTLLGTAVSRINWIGPTPNLQMGLPFEHPWSSYYHQPLTPAQDSFQLYKALFPASWKKYAPMMEAWNAGKIGRSAIIAHGTTIDPEYYAGKPFYPLTPTMGCLCAREQWNVTTGRLLLSEQYGLVSTYSQSPGKNGYLFVINLDTQEKPVSRAEVEKLVNQFESNR